MSQGNTENENQMEEESFAEMFEASYSGISPDVKVGDKVKGKIISVTRDAVFIDTGTKIDGVADKDELCNEEGEFLMAEGDEVELYVVKKTANEIRLSKALSGIGGLEMLRTAYEGKLPVEGRVHETCKGGFRIEMMHRRVFCPVSQIDARYVEDPEAYVGETFQFLIAKFEENGRNVVVSRRQLLDREKQAFLADFQEQLKPDTIMDGKVTQIKPYGAFVELAPGVEGMVHISELSWSRVETPEEVIQLGDTFPVKILGVEQDKKGLKISLSRKQVSDNPWNTLEGTFNPGDSVQGKVTRCAKFGAFVEISEGVEGLVHLSEMSYLKRVHKAEDVVQPGQTVTVVVKEIDLPKRRISLSLRDAEGDPWQDVAEKLKVGQPVTGTLEKKEQFGFFITLLPGITGLMPMSRIKRAEKSAALEKLNPGDEVAVVVTELNTAERKATLGIPGEEQDNEDWKSFSKPAASSAGPSMGSLGDMLQQAMQKKNAKGK